MEDSLHSDRPEPGIGTSLPGESSLPDAGSLAPPDPRLGAHRMSEATRDAIARMIVMGAPVSTIAATTGRTSSTIYAAMQSGPLAEKIEQVRGEVIRQTATHYFELLSMLPSARVAIQGGLASQDERCRLETAKWLHTTVVPTPTARQEVDLRVSGGLNHDVTGVLEQIGTALATIRQANVGRDPLARVRTGPEALPRVALLPTGDPAA